MERQDNQMKSIINNVFKELKCWGEFKENDE